MTAGETAPPRGPAGESQGPGAPVRWRLGRPSSRLRQARIVLAALPGWLGSARQRRLLAEMRRFVRTLSAALEGAVPEALEALTPAPADEAVGAVGETALRRLADLASLLERRSPVGTCLRRSLVRFHFLRRAGVPVGLRFGARAGGGAGGGPGDGGRRLTGHAWVVLDGEPYFEAPGDVEGYAVVLTWPPSPGERRGGRSGVPFPA